MEIVKIANNDLQVKMWNGQRVVTFKDIDRVHERPEGTASRNFRENKEYFILNEDYFVIKPSNIQNDDFRLSGISESEINNRGTYFITEMGYLMISKSLMDPLAWKVQRELVNTYFKFKEATESLQPNGKSLILSDGKFIEAVDTITTCAAIFQNMIDYSTTNYKQQQDLLQTARRRVNNLLGGAHSEEYKEWSRIYFKNLWQDFCKVFECGSYKVMTNLDMQKLIVLQNEMYLLMYRKRGFKHD